MYDKESWVGGEVGLVLPLNKDTSRPSGRLRALAGEAIMLLELRGRYMDGVWSVVGRPAGEEGTGKEMGGWLGVLGRRCLLVELMVDLGVEAEADDGAFSGSPMWTIDRVG